MPLRVSHKSYKRKSAHCRDENQNFNSLGKYFVSKSS